MRLPPDMSPGDLEHDMPLDLLKRDIARRLRGVCSEFEEEDFMELVDRIAEIDVRYRLRDQWTFERVLTTPTFN